METYLNIDELESFMGDRWSDSFTEKVETWLLPYGSAALRQIFKAHGMDLDERMEKNDTEPILVKSVLAEMISASLESEESSLPLGESNQLSQAAGGYSFSISGLSGTNLYLKKAQARALGLPGIVVESLKIN